VSYRVSLVGKNSGLPVEVENHEEGGTYVLGGVSEATLNITYNYGAVFSLVDADYGGLEERLHGVHAKDSVPWLESMVERLGTQRYRDYWAPTPGNAGYALSILLSWAKANPDALWEVS